MNTMRNAILIILFAAVLQAQTPPQLSFGSVTKGELSATVEIKLTGSGVGIAGLQFSLPPAVAPVTSAVVVGPVAVAAEKGITCAANATRQLCLIIGINSKLLQDGVVAVLTVAAPTAQTVNEVLADLLGATLDGTVVTITAGVPVSVGLFSRCDLNNDGKTDIADVTGAVGQALGIAACTSANITGRGKCDLLDVQRIVNAALTGVCKVL